MNAFALTSFLCGSWCLLLALIAPLTGKTKAHYLVMFFNIAVAFWGCGCFIAAASTNKNTALLGWKIAYLGSFFIPVLFYHLIFVSCELKTQPFLLFLGYGQAIVLNLLDITTHWVVTDAKQVFGFYFHRYTPLFGLAFFFYFSYVFFTLIRLGFYLTQAKDTNKVQAQYIFWGFFIGFSGGTTIVFPMLGIDFVYPVGNLGVCIYALIITFAILRNKFLLNLPELAQKAHKDKLAAIGTLAASINHELRNPLFIAKGKIESHLNGVEEKIYLSADEEIKQSRSVLKTAHDQLGRAMDIMQRLSDFAKPFGGRNDREHVILKEAFENVIHLVSNEFEMKKIKLNQVNTNGLSVMANRRQIEEIFFNLVLNSCQAMGERGGELGFDAYCENGHVAVEIRDNGPGIPSHMQKHVFEPFYSTKGEKGSGLGLHITKQLVERNNGKISVKSKIGDGTIFTLEFSGK